MHETIFRALILAIAHLAWLTPAGAVVGGVTEFAGAGRLCRLEAFGSRPEPLKRATAVLVSPNVLATARHLLPPETSRISVRCGDRAVDLDVRDVMSDLGHGPDVVLIETPETFAITEPMVVPRTMSEWRDARARAVAIHVAGFGGRYDLEPARIEEILRTHAPERIDPALVSRDAMRIAKLMTANGPPARDVFLSGLITPKVEAALREALEDVRPTALPVRIAQEVSRFGRLKASEFGYLTDAGGSIYVGDSGGAIFAQDEAGVTHLLGIVSRGGLRLKALPAHLFHVRHVWQRIGAYRRRGLTTRFPATPSVFAARLTGTDRAAVITPPPCQGDLFRD